MSLEALVTQGLFPIAAVLAALVATAPDRLTAPGSSQRFLVGPGPEVVGRDVRFLVELPNAYLPLRYRPGSATPVATPRVPFVAYVRDFSPVEGETASEPGIVSGTIGWAEPGYVRRSVDGSWDNHYSVYTRPGGERFGLEMRLWQDYQWMPAELYVSLSEERQLRIECAFVAAPDRPQLCEMAIQRPGQPFVELVFREDDLPSWRRIADQTDEHVRSWLRSE